MDGWMDGWMDGYRIKPILRMHKSWSEDWQSLLVCLLGRAIVFESGK
jgi:hypothetical protein